MKHIISIAFVTLMASYCIGQDTLIHSAQDSLMDKFGYYYHTDDIKIPIDTSDSKANSFPNAVVAGFFRLHFYDKIYSTGIGFDDQTQAQAPYSSYTIGELRIEVIKRVFEDLCILIRPNGELPDPYPDEYYAMLPNDYFPNSRYVEIAILESDSGLTTTGYFNNVYLIGDFLAISSPFYFNDELLYSGVVHNEIWEYINAGYDTHDFARNFTGYDSIPYSQIEVLPHGYLKFNFYKPEMDTSNIDLYLNTPQYIYDLYTICLHEAVHLLGFVSFFDNTIYYMSFGYCTAWYGTSSNCPGLFTAYDHLLQYDNNFVVESTDCYTSVADSALLSADIVYSCNNEYLTFWGIDSQLVYTNSTFAPGENYCHFNCTPQSGYVMNHSYVEQTRSLHYKEVQALSLLGYSVTGEFGTGMSWCGQNDSIAAITYTCQVDTQNIVAGCHDYRYYSTDHLGSYLFPNPSNSKVRIPVASLLANDYNADYICCFEKLDFYNALINFSVITATSTLDSLTSHDTITIEIPIYEPYVYLFQYVPKNSFGKRGNRTLVFFRPENLNILYCSQYSNCDNLICHGDFEDFENLQQFNDELFITKNNDFPNFARKNNYPLYQYLSSTETVYSGSPFLNSNLYVSLNPIFNPANNGGEKFGFFHGSASLTFKTKQTIDPNGHYKITFIARNKEANVTTNIRFWGGETQPCCKGNATIVNTTLGSTTSCGACGLPDYTTNFSNSTINVTDTIWVEYSLDILPGDAIGPVNYLSVFSYGTFGIDNIEIEEVKDFDISIGNLSDTTPCIGVPFSCEIYLCNNDTFDSADSVTIFIELPPFIEIVPNAYFDASGTCIVPADSLVSQFCYEVSVELMANEYCIPHNTVFLPVSLSSESCWQGESGISFVPNDNTLSITKTVVGDTIGYKPGDEVEFLNTVINNNDVPVNNVIIQDTLPTGLIYSPNNTEFDSLSISVCQLTNPLLLAPFDTISFSFFAVFSDTGTCNPPWVNTAWITDAEEICYLPTGDSAMVYQNGFGLSFTSTSMCNHDNDIEVVPVSVAGPFDFLWSTGATTQTITVFGVGEYCVTVSKTNDPSCFATGCHSNVPVINDSVMTTSSQCNNCLGTATVYPYGGISPYSYYWSTGDFTQSIDSLCRGDYPVIIWDSSNCFFFDTISIVDSLGFRLIGFDANCPGDSSGYFSILMFNPANPTTFYWSTGDTLVLTSGSSILYQNLPAGVYSVTITDNNGCVGYGTGTISNLYNFYAEVINITNATCADTCNGSMVVELINYNLPLNFNYNLSNGQSIYTSSINQSFQDLCTGIYSLTVSDTIGCTHIIDSIEVDVETLDFFYTVVAPYCTPTGAGEIDCFLSGWVPPYSYSWNTAATTQDIYPTQTGTYTVIVTDAMGCKDTLQCVIESQDIILLNENVISPTCEYYLSGYASVSVSGGQSPYSILWGTGENSFELVQLSTGGYTYTVTDDYGCTGEGEIIITNENLLSATLDGLPPLCDSSALGSIQSEVSGGISPYLYYWSNSETTSEINNLTIGTYSLTVVDSIYCSDVVNYEFPYLWLGLDTNILGQGCDGIYNHPSVYLTNGEIHIEATGGTPPYEYIWNNGFPITDFYEQSDSTAYTITVSDANGCQATALIRVGSDQEILLKYSWSLYSTYITPFGNPYISETFIAQGLENEVLVIKDGNGNIAWWPDVNYDPHIAYAIGAGYQIKMNSEQTYYIKGHLVCPEDNEMNLSPNWNIPGYLRTSASPITTEFSSFYQDIIIIKDDSGLVYWPQYSLFQFNDLLPGEGYQLKDSSAHSFYYTSNSILSGTKSHIWKSPDQFHYFIDTSNLRTGTNMILMLPNECWEEVPGIGSEIGIIGENGQLTGRAIFDGQHTPVLIYGDDITTPNEEGLAEGESFTISVCEPASKNSKSLKINRWIKGNDIFSEGKVSIAGKNNVVDVLDNKDKEIVILFPNPSSGTLWLQMQLMENRQVSYRIYSFEGKKVYEMANIDMFPGVHEFEVNLQFCNSGTYTLQLIMDDVVKHVKFVVIK
ncbi:MAG: hypothetical protein K9H64_04915 [Bacteroidales bacterium]|nr:hypothetical protein [Bacteroidales bacterium]MCF8455178.1 hypothetical protein [Bacteroidales bacterium]